MRDRRGMYLDSRDHHVDHADGACLSDSWKSLHPYGATVRELWQSCLDQPITSSVTHDIQGRDEVSPVAPTAAPRADQPAHAEPLGGNAWISAVENLTKLVEKFAAPV